VLLAIVLLSGLLLGLRLLLPLPFLSARPALQSAAPPDGASGVSPRARATLHFTMAMNPRSVERALHIVPAAPVALLWQDGNTTLTISPTASLQPETTYHVTLDHAAYSRMFRALERPVNLSFRIAQAPAVVAVLPAAGAVEVLPAAPISITFSRPIISAAAVTLTTSLPELHFDPPISGTAAWLDQANVLFRPAEPLRPSTRYRVTLDAGLTDLEGGQLGSAFTWSFSTPAPKLLSVSPARGARAVAPRAPLVLTFSQPLDLASVRASLVITPANGGDWTAATLPDATQQITYTPATDWQPDTTYTIALRAGVAPVSGTLPLLDAVRWSFTAAPQPTVTGRFPGEGQTLPLGQALRLIFNTPMDEQSLRAAVRFTPPVDAIRVTARDVEARISADLLPTTIYTVTLPASLTDRNGVPLGQEYRIRFQTASAAPELALPEAFQHIARLVPAQAVGLLIRRTNLSALNLDLYGLDEATIVRTLAFREDGWIGFQPERYAQPLLRSWRVQLADPLNTPVQERLPLAIAEGAPLPPGAYYLRIRTPDGPRADLLLLVSRTRLILQESSGGGALIWATDMISATALADLPVALYQDGGLIQRGATDQNGLWRIDRPVGIVQTLVALVEGDQPSIASTIWSGANDLVAPERYRAFLTTDRAAYRPGERVELAGFVRYTADQTNTLPAPGLQPVLTVRQIGATIPVYRATLNLDSSGLISERFTLPAATPVGEYILAVALGNDISHTTFTVRAEAAQPLLVSVRVPEQRATGNDVPVTVEARTPEGLPLSGAVISWTLSAERLPYPTRDGYVIGDDELAPAPPVGGAGVGQTGIDGQLSLIITDTISSDVPLRYRIAVRATEPGGLSAATDGAFLVTPSQSYVALRLPSRILTASKPGVIELLAVTTDGQPLPAVRINIDVYYRTWVRAEATGPDAQPQTVLQPRDNRVLTHSSVAGADGTAQLPLTLGDGGEYRVIASVLDAAGRRMSSAITLWVAERGFTDWRVEPNDNVLLLTDRAAYRPGDTATLLLTSPFDAATALVTRSSSDGLASEVRTLRAGEPLTLTLRPEDAPALDVSVLLVGQRAGPVASFKFANATIPVLAVSRALSVTITPDQAIYAPGATATFSVTTTDDQGAGVPATVVLDVVGASGAPQRDPAETFRAGTPPPIMTAQLPGAPAERLPAPAPRPPPPIARAPEPAPAPSIYWNPTLHTDSSGVLTLTIQLPTAAVELRALAWAASGAERFGVTQSALAITQPLVLNVDAPPFLRAGDAVELAARIQNTRAVSQELTIDLTASGVTPQASAPLNRQLTLAPGETARVVWPVLVGDATQANLSFRLGATDGAQQTIRADRWILPSGTLVYTNGGALITGRLSQSLTLSEQARHRWGRLEIDLAPSSQALANEVAQSLNARPERSLLDEASLLLVSASFSETQPLVQASLDRLVSAQNGDGGWGWWPRGPSQPFISAVVLEALAAAGRAGLNVPVDVVEHGSAALAVALADQTTQADVRAYLVYVLTLHNRSDVGTLRTLAADARSLGPESLSYALLGDPADETASRLTARSRLESLAVRDGALAHWPAGADTLLSSDVSATALALLALERTQGDSDLIAGARRWLAAARGSGGWDSAYASARALAALRATDPAVIETPGQYVVSLNGAGLFEGSSSALITTTRSLTLTLDRIAAHNELTLLNSGDPIFLGYRIVSTADTPPPNDDGVGLLREYLDPLTGQPVDLAHLRSGQLVRVRLTAVATSLQRFVVVEDALPAGCVLVEASNSGPFEHIDYDRDHLTLSSAALGPDVYEYSYLLRAVVPGRYTAPAPTARLVGGHLLGTGPAAIINIVEEK
jgi:uncharacterized protein YfaS (alpha-2-macroglobulin family)